MDPRRSELLRKSIHMGSIGIPLVVWFLPRTLWRWPLIAFTLSVLILDLGRLAEPRIGALFRRWVGHALRPHEDRELIGSSYLAVACLISALVFPKAIAVAVMGYLILGDGLAGLVGRNWGRIPLLFGKTLEGTAAGLAANLLIGLLVFRDLGSAFFGAVLASAVELLPLSLDDNFAIPMLTGVGLWLAVG